MNDHKVEKTRVGLKVFGLAYTAIARFDVLPKTPENSGLGLGLGHPATMAKNLARSSANVRPRSQLLQQKSRSYEHICCDTAVFVVVFHVLFVSV